VVIYGKFYLRKKEGEPMRIFLVLAFCSLLLLGCSSDHAQSPVQTLQETGDFRLKLEVNKSKFQENEEIVLQSTFEYIGKKEIQFDRQPSFLIVIRNDDNGEIVQNVELNDLKQSMEKGETYTKEVKNIRLAKGKYSATFQTLSVISARSHSYMLSTSPISFSIR